MHSDCKKIGGANIYYITQNLKQIIGISQFNAKSFLSEYVNKPPQLLYKTFLVVNNTFSNNFKYPHARKA